MSGRYAGGKDMLSYPMLLLLFVAEQVAWILSVLVGCADTARVFYERSADPKIQAPGRALPSRPKSSHVNEFLGCNILAHAVPQEMNSCNAYGYACEKRHYLFRFIFIETTTIIEACFHVTENTLVMKSFVFSPHGRK